MTKITHPARILLKNEHLPFKKATVPFASAQGPDPYAASSPSLPKSIMIRRIEGKHTNKKAKKKLISYITIVELYYLCNQNPYYYIVYGSI